MTKKKNNKKQSINSNDEWPRVSVLTPLYNRNKWLPMMIMNLKTFDYDKNKLEWFILDSKDGDEDIRLLPNDIAIKNVQDIIHPIKLRYEYIPRKMTIAEKRTYLSKNMTHPWFPSHDPHNPTLFFLHN